MPVFPFRMNQRMARLLAWSLSVLVVLVGMGAFLLFVLKGPAPVPVMLLSKPVSIPISLRDRIARWVPAGNSWNWARKLVFGRRKIVSLSTQVFKLGKQADARAALASLGPPVFAEATGPTVWFLQGKQLKDLRSQLKQEAGIDNVNGARITTAEGMGASLFSGESAVLNGSTNQVGLEIQYFAKTRGEHLELLASVLLSEVVSNSMSASVTPAVFIRTNLDVALRMQLPKAHGMFLLSNAGNDPESRRIAVTLDPP